MKMKTLTLNGATYQVCDPVAVSFEEQTLTEEQKQQALQNLGIPEKTYELIEDVTLEEDVSSFVRTADPNGVAYNFSAVRMQIAAEPASSSSQLIFHLASNESEYLIYHQQNNGLSTSARVTGLIARNDRGFLDYFVLNGTANSPTTMSARNGFADIKPWGNICGITIFSASSNVTIPAGSRIRIYAVRG